MKKGELLTVENIRQEMIRHIDEVRRENGVSNIVVKMSWSINSEYENNSQRRKSLQEYFPNLKFHTDLTAVQKSMTEMQKSLTQMTSLLEQDRKRKEKRTCKWLNWLPDFNLIVVSKWIMLVLLIVAALLSMGYDIATVVSNI